MLLERETCYKVFFKLFELAYEFWVQKIQLWLFRAVQSKAKSINLLFGEYQVDDKYC